MLDAKLRPFIDPPLNAAGVRLARTGLTANQTTLLGMVAGVSAGIAIALGAFDVALGLIVLSRILDGLDGAIARATDKTDFGGYLDILCDFAFYVSVPIGFGFADPANFPFALILVASFTLTGVSFLAYAVLAGKRGETTTAHGEKSFFYNTGLAEGTETIVAFILMCLFPTNFALIGAIYAAMCFVTVLQRSIAARMDFS
jgi:phosphatidylglycerophosphate synthase